MTRICLLVLGLLFMTGCGAAATGAQQLALGSPGVWSARKAVRSIASGTATPESEPALWLADDRGVTELAIDGTATEAWKPPKFTRVLRLEAMDLDDDGASEWVVTLMGTRIRSLLLGWRDGAWVELARGRPGFLRPVIGPDGVPVLLGQSAGSDRPFVGPIKEVTLKDGKLVDGEALRLPPQLSVHDVFWVPEGDRVRLFSVESTDHLGERDPRSPRALIWRSDGRVVSRPVVVDREATNLLGEDVDSALELPVPPSVLDSDCDGTYEVLTVAGSTTPVAILQNVRVLQGADARMLVPGARGLEEVRRTPLLGRAMVGVVPWADVAGDLVWAAAVWVHAEAGFVRPETRVYLFDPSTGDLLPSSPPAADATDAAEAASP